MATTKRRGTPSPPTPRATATRFADAVDAEIESWDRSVEKVDAAAAKRLDELGRRSEDAIAGLEDRRANP